jgi:hypothetical protein
MTRFAQNRKRSLSLSLITLAVGGGIVAASTPARAGWSTPVQPPTACGADSQTIFSPQPVALNGNGLWVIAVGAMSGVNVCTSSDGVNWTGPTVIGQGHSAAVAVAPDGKIVVVWEGGTATSPDEEAAYKLPGGSWTAPVVLDSSPAGHPLVSMDGSGNAIAVWVPGSGAAKTASLPATGSWTATTTLSDGYDIGLATNSSGQAIVGVRAGHDGPILAFSGTILGGFGAGVKLAGSYANAHHPLHISMNAAGAAAFDWESGNGALIALRGTDGTWGTPTTWETGNHHGIGSAIDNTGNVIVAFGQYTGLGNPVPVYGALHPAGGSWGSAVLLSSLSDLGNPLVTGDPAGTFVVAWTNSSSTITALTIPPGGGLTGTTAVVSPGTVFELAMTPGLAVMWTAAGGIAKGSVN